MVDSDEVQDADEVLRRLENISDDVNAFLGIFQDVYYGHLGVEEKLAEINQILSRLNVERLEDEAGEQVSRLSHDPNYVIVNASNPHPCSTSGTSYYYVLPGEEPRTFATLNSLAEEIASLVDEYEHILGQTLQVYRLCPMPEEHAQLRARVGAALRKLEAEDNALDGITAL